MMSKRVQRTFTHLTLVSAVDSGGSEDQLFARLTDVARWRRVGDESFEESE